MKKLFTFVFVTVFSIIAFSSTTATASSQEPSTNYWTNTCCTSVGNCFVGQVVQNNLPCWCNVPGGTVNGLSC